jgi:hypothetical protein
MAKRTNRTASVLALALVVMGSGGLSAETDPFSTIVRKRITLAKLDQALARLPLPPTEPPQFWTRITNDSHYRRFHRRRAVFQLFRRHVEPGMSISELGLLLSHPTWLRSGDILWVNLLRGHIPVRLDPKDTVFVLVVLPDAGKDQDGIYLRVSGKVEEKQFQSLLLSNGKASKQAGSARILEMGLCEDPREKPCEHKGSRT